jgi:hypothetical protein
VSKFLLVLTTFLRRLLAEGQKLDSEIKASIRRILLASILFYVQRQVIHHVRLIKMIVVKSPVIGPGEVFEASRKIYLRF